MAAFSYMKLKNMTKAERFKMKKDLLDYCCMDTLAMVKLIESLKKALDK